MSTSERKQIPHGTYMMDQSWSKDKDSKYYKGWQIKVMWPIIKALLLILVVVTCNTFEFKWW